ncbi:MAG: hypothetical protein AAF604_24145, partial [Acidobacteriota bacterium]
VQTLVLGANGVSQLEVRFTGSGAVAGLVFDCEGGICISGGQVKDSFKQVSFGNNDGPDDWAGDWIEDDVSSPGPQAGRVRIANGFLFLDDYPNTGTEPSVAREVDMSGANSATLEFAFDTAYGVDPSDAVTVEVSNDGGATWTVLEVITGISGTVEESRSFDISAFISSQTQVRFRVSKKYGGQNEFFCLRFVKITWSCEEPTPSEHYSGSLKQGDAEVQPNGTYFYSEAGQHEGVLEGAAGTDFDLELYRWNGSKWQRVAGSWTYSSSESVVYDASAGYYFWRVSSYSGSGAYDLWIVRP